MNRIKNLTFKLLLLTVGITLTFFSCQDEITNEQTKEQNIIEYGISQSDFENSNAFNGILSRLNSNNGLSNRTDGTANQLTSQELLQRLDLSKGYMHHHDDGKELLSVPVRTQGDYKRVLLSLTRDNFTNSFLLTYPDSTNNKLYYVSSLDGVLLQKVTIQDNGIGITETFNTQEHSHGTASRSSTGGCTETVYEACSSGNHSFAWGNAMECTYWNLSGGTPPTVATIDVGCSGGGGTSGGSSGGSSGGGTSGGGTNTGGGGFNGGDGDGFNGVPIVKGGNSLVDADDCVANLDCDECNLGPHDIDGDCNLTATEVAINSINNCVGVSLTSSQKTFLNRNPQIVNAAYTSLGAITFSCNPDTVDFFNEIIDDLEDGDEVEFEEQVIQDSTFVNNQCLKGVYDQMGKASTFKNYLQNFEPEFSVAHLKFSSSTSLASTTNAETSPPNNYLITITFNENNLDRPSLSVARTMIHEMIHAEIFRKLLSAAGQPNLNYTGYTDEEWRNFIITLRNNFPGLYDYYLRWSWNVPAGQSPSSAQHEAMAQHYRDIIKQALMEYDSNQTDATYEALAWTGLMGSGDYDSTTGLYSNSTVAWSSLSQTERLNIISTINTFNSSNPNCQN